MPLAFVAVHGAVTHPPTDSHGLVCACRPSESRVWMYDNRRRLDRL